MKTMCPTCILLGLVALPFELLYRGVGRLFGREKASASTPV